jgi:tyrosyl-tRNA synthetase
MKTKINAVKGDKSSFSSFGDARMVERVLTRNVVEILPDKEGLKKLMMKKRIRLYLGVDPTGTRLHLGHTVALRKLQEFADLGHESILVVGTGTVLAGDPSARDKARPRITQKEIEKNIETWKAQAGKVLDFSRVKIKYNGDWLLKLTLRNVIEIASNISAVKLLQRDMFQKRLKAGSTVWTHEILYPLLQGYDSVAMDVDLEIGGTDQVFNMLIGRELQEKMRKREKFVLTLPMILGIDGKAMSKSSGNCVWLDDSADQMFGKIMSIPDELILPYLEVLTNVSPRDLQGYKKELQSRSVNPVELKKQLAFEIVKIYHSKNAAEKARDEFKRVFKEKKAPLSMPETKIKESKVPLVDLLVETKLASSKSEAKRQILQGAVKIDGEIKKDWKEVILPRKGMVLQSGKRRFAKIG